MFRAGHVQRIFDWYAAQQVNASGDPVIIVKPNPPPVNTKKPK